MTKNQAIFDRMLREAFKPQKLSLQLIHACKICKEKHIPSPKSGYLCDNCREALR